MARSFRNSNFGCSTSARDGARIHFHPVYPYFTMPVHVFIHILDSLRRSLKRGLQEVLHRCGWGFVVTKMETVFEELRNS